MMVDSWVDSLLAKVEVEDVVSAFICEWDGMEWDGTGSEVR